MIGRFSINVINRSGIDRATPYNGSAYAKPA